jgi:predicted metal-dependent hydrolase
MKSSPRKEFVFGSFIYHYDLLVQDRLTLSLTVKPDLGITLKAPHGAEHERVETFLKKKWFWLEKQLRFFKKYQRRMYSKEYISGEGFLYLGRQYKLVVKRASKDKVAMTKGLLMVYTSKGVPDKRHVKELLDTWYEEKTERVFCDRYKLMKSKFDYKEMPPLVIREMRKRWGSFLDNKTIILNPKLIHTSRECIDYVIVHELCHMRYKNHDSNFYKFLKKKYPKWEKVKDKLETIGVQTS